VKISGFGRINGVIYTPNPTTQSLVHTTMFMWTDLYGGVVGNTSLYGYWLLGLLTITRNSTNLEKFYTYSINASSIEIDRLSWTSIY